MKQNTRLITLFAFVAGLLWLNACAPVDESPPAILSEQPLNGASAPARPSGAVDDAAILPTPTATLAEDAADAVMWNPEERPLALLPVVQELTRPLFIAHAGDGSGRLFVVEQPGVIRIWQDGEVAATPYLDITDRVNDGGNEQGLLGLAFAPDYAESGRFYVNYTDVDGNTVVARYNGSATNVDVADPASESVILTVEQPARNHNGGMLAFGPDGYLYIGMGDGGAANDRFGNGQNPATLLGKMLRIDVSTTDDQSYSIPADNPWVGSDWNGEDVRDEIWAVGLRNPWRFSFDRADNDLWIGDVGQNQYEEVNHVPADQPVPLNFGWPIMEGTNCFGNSDCDKTGLWQPMVDYGRGDGCSVTGGYVYRGAVFPALNGVYFFGDYCTGKIWAVLPDGEDGSRAVEVLDTEMSISSFGEDENGELYVADLQGGVISRLTISED